MSKAEYNVMRRVRGSKNPDTLVRKCETSTQAWKHINDMPSAKDRAEHYVQYNKEAIRQYELNRASRGMG